MSDLFIVVAVGDSTMGAASVPSFFYQSFGITFRADTDHGYGGDQPRYAEKHYVGSDTICINTAVFGEKLTPDMVNRATARNVLTSSGYTTAGGKPRRFHVLVVQAGTNVDNADPAVSAASMRTYCLAAQAAGWHVIVCPAWSKTGVGIDDFMQARNAIIDGYTVSDGVDRVLPCTEVLLYADGAYANPVYFDVDGIHPTAAGHALKADHLTTAWTSLKAQLSAS